QPLSNVPHENWVQSQKKNIRKHAPLYFQPTRKRLMAWKEGNRPSCLEEAAKLALFLEFPSRGVANIANNHMPLVRYIGQFTAWETMLFQQDIFPSCANARENNPRMDIAGQEFFICAPERNTVRVLHCNSSLHCAPFVASFAPSRLHHASPPMKSKALTSKFRYQAVFSPSCRKHRFNRAAFSLGEDSGRLRLTPKIFS